MQVEMQQRLSYIGTNKYLETTKDWMMKCVLSHENSKKLFSIPKKTKGFLLDYSCRDVDGTNLTPTQAAKKIKTAARIAAASCLKNNWTKKPLHGKFPERVSNADIDRIKTYSWLKSSTLRAETEGFVLAAQDQSLKTKNYVAKIMKASNDPNCRYCGAHQETIDHLLAGCPTLAKNEYLIRHNKVAQYVHWQTCKGYGIAVKGSWYDHETPSVIENERVKILWDFSVQTDRTIKANRPDIIIKEKETNKC